MSETFDATDPKEVERAYHRERAANITLRERLAAAEAERDENEKAREMHANINEAVAKALGQGFGESWHDLGEKVALTCSIADEALASLAIAEGENRRLQGLLGELDDEKEKARGMADMHMGAQRKAQDERDSLQRLALEQEAVIAELRARLEEAEELLREHADEFLKEHTDRVSSSQTLGTRIAAFLAPKEDRDEA